MSVPDKLLVDAVTDAIIDSERTPIKMLRFRAESYAIAAIKAYEEHANNHPPLTCSTCGKPMPQTAVPAEKAWCSPECYDARSDG